VARDFGKVRSAFWSDDKVQAWPERIKFMALYMLTAPHANAIGCFRAPVQYIAADTGLTVTDVKDALTFLERHNFLRYCHKTGFVFIKNYLTHNGIENAKVGVHCTKLAMALPRSLPFLAEIETVLKAALSSVSVQWIGFGYPIDTVSEPYRTPEPEPEPEPEPRRTHASHDTAAPSAVVPISQSPLDLKKEYFARGVSYLKTCGLEDRDARAMLGKWRRDHGEVATLMALASAEGAAVSEPIPYIQTILRNSKNGRSSNTNQPISDHPLGIFGQLGDEISETAAGDRGPDRAKAVN
jgi:hypothetical protein